MVSQNVFNIQDLTEGTGGSLLSQHVTEFTGLGTDTRKDLRGQFFIALRGDRFDAHDYLETAVQAGATALIVDKAEVVTEDLKSKVTVILVKDSLKALQELARYWRRKCGFQVLAITGSNGKTTTKGFLATLLEYRFSVHYSQGSFNNHWGLPMTLLAARPHHEKVVVEMGMNHRGEIKTLCEIAEPDIVVCTMVGTSHIGELGSKEAIRLAKKEIYDYSPDADWVFNLDNEGTIAIYDELKSKKDPSKVSTFASYRSGVDVQLKVNWINLGSIEVEGRIDDHPGRIDLEIFGRQNSVNLMAAATMALRAGMTSEEIWHMFPQLKTGWGRNELRQMKSGATLLFDAYNANPDSVTILLKNIYELDVDRRRIVVLGQMGELGSLSGESHQRIGELCGQCGFDVVVFIGADAQAFKSGVEASGFQKTLIVSDTYKESLAKQVGDMLKPDDIVVVKGSRFNKLERLLDVWEQ